jgi:hypothetical protein
MFRRFLVGCVTPVTVTRSVTPFPVPAASSRHAVLPHRAVRHRSPVGMRCRPVHVPGQAADAEPFPPAAVVAGGPVRALASVLVAGEVRQPLDLSIDCVEFRTDCVSTSVRFLTFAFAAVPLLLRARRRQRWRPRSTTHSLPACSRDQRTSAARQKLQNTRVQVQHGGRLPPATRRSML